MIEFLQNIFRELDNKENDIIIIKDLKNNIIFASKGFKELFKFSLSQATFGALTNEILAAIDALDAECLDTKNTVRRAIKIPIDNIIEEVEIEKNPLLFNGEIICILCELKRKKNHSESDNLISIFKIIADQFSLLTWTSGPDKLCNWFNKTWLDFTGRTMAQELGNGWANGVHPEDLNACVGTYCDAFDKRAWFKMSYRLKNATGKYRYVHDYGSPIFNPNGEFLGYFGFVWDANEEIVAANSLKENQDRLVAFTKNTYNGILIVNNDGRIIEHNASLERISGLTKSDIIGQYLWDFEYKYLRNSDNTILDFEVNKKRLEDFFSNSKVPWLSLPFEHIFLNPNGERKFVKIQNFSIETRKGKNLGILITDISEQKNAIDELFLLNKNLEEANNIKSIIINNLGHELRTPLNGVLGFAQILKYELENTEYYEAIDIVYQSGERLKNTLNSLLYLTELESHTIKFSAEIVDMKEFVEFTIRTSSDQIETSGLYLKFEIPEEPITTFIDIYLLKQIATNIIDNCIKFTKSGGITIAIFSKDIGENKYAGISIKDTGIGIPKDQIGKIFEPFRQASEGIARPYEGIGLGLTITKKMVEMMNGMINVYSEVNIGSEFELLFPFCEAL